MKPYTTRLVDIRDNDAGDIEEPVYDSQKNTPFSVLRTLRTPGRKDIRTVKLKKKVSQ